MLRRYRLTLTAGLALGVILCAGCRRDQRSTVKVMGSTSIQPFAEMLGQEYEKQNSQRKVTVEGGGSAAGLQAASSGLAAIGMCSRELTSDEAGGFNRIVIARDGVGVVAHPDNGVHELSTAQLRGIFSGHITNWNEVGGRDARILVVTREEGSGTREAFTHLVMGDEPIARTALSQASNGAVKAIVQGNRDAIGYMSLGQIGTELRALRIDGQEATEAGVHAGKYKLARPFLFVTKGTPDPDAVAFIDFVLSDEGQKLLENEGLIRAQ